MARPSLIGTRGPLVIEGLEAGLTHARAASYAGIHEGTLQEWLRRGRAESKGRYHEFAREVEKTEAFHVKKLLGVIETASGRNWAAAAWILERRYGHSRPPSTQVAATVNVQAATPGAPPKVNSKAGREELVQAVMELPQDILLESLRRAKAVELARKGKKGKRGK